MATHLLVSDPDRHGESGRVCLCDNHLASALARSPLGASEYVITADDDVDCEQCLVDKHTARQRRSQSWSMPRRAIEQGAHIEGAEMVWPEGDRYPTPSGDDTDEHVPPSGLLA